MTDHAGYVDAKEHLVHHSGTNGTLSHKRKREALDPEISNPRASPGNGSKLPGFRTGGGNETGDMTDQTTATYLAAHNASAAMDEELQQSANTSIDFSALAQNNAGEHDQHHEPHNHHNRHQHPSDNDLHPNGRATVSSASDTAAAALSHYSMTVPQATELSFQTQSTPGSGAPGDGDGNRQLNSSYGMSEQHNSVQHGHAHGMSDFSIEAALKAGTHASQMPVPGESPPQSTTPGRKPTVGSDEWNKIRRDNHKEVERRRRETINEGINELAKIVPGCEKNKGSILQRAVQFITQLKENEAQNIEKWTLEKLLTEQAIAELSASCDKLKAECQRAWTEVETWKKAAADAGVDVKSVATSGGNNSEAEGREGDGHGSGNGSGSGNGGSAMEGVRGSGDAAKGEEGKRPAEGGAESMSGVEK